MADPPSPGAGEIRSVARGPHWIAWVADESGKPVGAVVLVGESREEAEDRARRWRDRTMRRTA